MARYRLKRKTFGALEAAGNVLGNTAGGVMKGAGSVLDSNAGRVVGGLAGAKVLGSAIKYGLGGGLGAGLVGGIAGYVAGKNITGGVGKGLKDAGQSLQDRSV